MSNPMIHAWLADELDEEGLRRLEEWLREDSSHRREFVYAVSLQEELRAAYRPRETVRRMSLLPAARIEWFRFMGLAATLVLCAMILFWNDEPGTNAPSSTNPFPSVVVSNKIDRPIPESNPDGGPSPKNTVSPRRIEVVSGDVVVNNPAAQRPVPIRAPYGNWTRGTGQGAVAGEKGGVVRWGADLELRLGPRAVVRFEPDVAKDPSGPVRTVNLDQGELRVLRPVEQRPSPAPVARLSETVEVATRFGRIVAEDADFTVTCLSGQPSDTDEVTVSVSNGVVRIRNSAGERIVPAGETVRISNPVRDGK